METTTRYNANNLIQEAEQNKALNQLNEAINLYERAISLNQSDLEIYNNLGALYEKTNNTHKAKEIYKKGILNAKQLANKCIETELSFTLLGLMD